MPSPAWCMRWRSARWPAHCGALRAMLAATWWIILAMTPWASPSSALGAEPSSRIVTSTATCRVSILSVRSAKGSPDGRRPGADGWVPVTLPDAWGTRWPDYSGTVWYRVDWQRHCDDGATSTSSPVALGVESMVMAGEIYLGDDLLWRDDSLTEPLSRSWNMPRYWLLPEAMLHDGVNTVWFRVIGYAQLPSGMGVVHLGDMARVSAVYRERTWHNRTLMMANLIASGVMAGLFLFAWLASGRKQSAYGWYALMSLLWVLFVYNVVALTPWPVPNTLLMSRVNIMLLMAYAACFGVFTWRFSEQHRPKTERCLWTVTALVIAILGLVPDANLRAVLNFGAFAATAVFLVSCLQFIGFALRTRTLDHLLVAFCYAIFVAVSVHDWLYLLRIITDQPGLPFSSAVETLGMSSILGLRMARDARRGERFNVELAETVALARSELATTLAREHALSLTNTRLQERLQIAHELHDGFGSSLVRLMAMVEQTAMPIDNTRFLSQLKLMRNDLRQTIDTGTSAGVKVPATPTVWIAPLRHRFMQLFDEMDIRAEWQFPQTWQRPPNAIQCLALTRLVEEAMANIIKHSRARNVRLTLAQSAQAVLTLCIVDDGIGFDVAAVQSAGVSVGMRSMQTRIARVGGLLEVSSRAGETMLLARLPIDALESMA